MYGKMRNDAIYQSEGAVGEDAGRAVVFEIGRSHGRSSYYSGNLSE